MLINTATQSEVLASAQTFTFEIGTGSGKIAVEPKTSGAGKYAHGHARINKRGTGERTLIWECNQMFQIEFAELDSSADVATGDIGDLFKQTTGPAASGGIFKFEGKLRSGGSCADTVVYKYTIRIAGFEDLDPLIIVDR